MRTIGNIIWFLCGGLIMGLTWWLVGLIAFVTIIGIPWGRACFVIGEFSFFPFGREAITRAELDQYDIGTGVLGVLGNIIWFLLAGLWLAIGHLMMALICFILIIGIPFGIQHLKLAGLALAPIGKTIIDSQYAQAMRAGAIPVPGRD
ncbi:MAG: YccF domain-containing protein [Pseudohongiella sp.]